MAVMVKMIILLTIMAIVNIVEVGNRQILVFVDL